MNSSLPQPQLVDDINYSPNFLDEFKVLKKSVFFPELISRLIDGSFLSVMEGGHVCIYAISKETSTTLCFEKRESGPLKNRNLYIANAKLARDHAKSHGLTRGYFQLN